MPVEGHLGDPRFGENAVDAGGPIAVALEQSLGGVDQMFAAAGPTPGSPCGGRRRL
jgi:hypothetical protein